MSTCLTPCNLPLQQHRYVFDLERETYEKEDVADKVPMINYQDNSACCDLVERSSREFVGIMPLLDDYKDKQEAEDEDFCEDLIRRWGRRQHQPPKHAKRPPEKCKNAKAKAACRYFYGSKAGGNTYFCIQHFAGDIRYDVEGFLEKNKDKVSCLVVACWLACLLALYLAGWQAGFGLPCAWPCLSICSEKGDHQIIEQLAMICPGSEAA